MRADPAALRKALHVRAFNAAVSSGSALDAYAFTKLAARDYPGSRSALVWFVDIETLRLGADQPYVRSVPALRRAAAAWAGCFALRLACLPARPGRRCGAGSRGHAASPAGRRRAGHLVARLAARTRPHNRARCARPDAAVRADLQAGRQLSHQRQLALVRDADRRRRQPRGSGAGDRPHAVPSCPAAVHQRAGLEAGARAGAGLLSIPGQALPPAPARSHLAQVVRRVAGRLLRRRPPAPCHDEVDRRDGRAAWPWLPRAA